MSVLAEGFSVIVRRSTIETTFPGGIAEYKRIVPNKTFCSDQHLTRVGFLDWPEVTRFLERLRAVGLSHHYVDGHGVDIGVVHQDEGMANLTPWLQWGRDDAGRSISWLAGTDAGQLAVPEDRAQDSSLAYISDLEGAKRLIPLEDAPNDLVVVDSGSGQIASRRNDEEVQWRTLSRFLGAALVVGFGVFALFYSMKHGSPSPNDAIADLIGWGLDVGGLLLLVSFVGLNWRLAIGGLLTWTGATIYAWSGIAALLLTLGFVFDKLNFFVAVILVTVAAPLTFVVVPFYAGFVNGLWLILQIEAVGYIVGSLILWVGRAVLATHRAEPTPARN